MVQSMRWKLSSDLKPLMPFTRHTAHDVMRSFLIRILVIAPVAVWAELVVA
jgi:hypothetical protein